jgi:hypothetical protein
MAWYSAVNGASCFARVRGGRSHHAENEEPAAAGFEIFQSAAVVAGMVAAALELAAAPGAAIAAAVSRETAAVTRILFGRASASTAGFHFSRKCSNVKSKSGFKVAR